MSPRAVGFDFNALKFERKSRTSVWFKVAGETGFVRRYCLKLVSEVGYPPKWGLFRVVIDLAGFYESYELGYFNSIQELADAVAAEVDSYND